VEELNVANPLTRAMERFERHIEKLADAPGCWLWTGSLFRDGYGQFPAVGERRAHRFAWVA